MLGVQERITECPTACAATPVPEMGTVATGFAASLLDILSAPPAYPTDVGPKLTETVTDAPGCSVTLEPPLTPYPFPETETAEMFRFAVPLFVRLSSSAVAEPTLTLPKLKLELLTERIAEPVGVDVEPEVLPVVDVPVVPVPAACRVAPTQPAMATVAIKAVAAASLRAVVAQFNRFSKSIHTFVGNEAHEHCRGLKLLKLLDGRTYLGQEGRLYIYKERIIAGSAGGWKFSGWYIAPYPP